MEMIKFEIEVLRDYTFGQLIHTKEELNKAKEYTKYGITEANDLKLTGMISDLNRILNSININLSTINKVIAEKEEKEFIKIQNYQAISLN